MTVTRRHGRAAATTLLLALLALYPTSALDAAERSVVRRAANFAPGDQAGITRQQAVGEVRRLFDGRVLSATPVERGGRPGFRVRLLTREGRVRNVYVDGGGVVPEG